MSSKKDLLLALIRANPSISQQELAEQLQLSRSAVAGHIAGLIKDGRILGRAYVLPDAKPVVCIGGANIDRKLRTLSALQMGTSNPVTQQESYGGVARNIAENLSRLGLPAQLLTAVGDDAAGKALLSHAESTGIDVRGCLQMVGEISGSYTALLDHQGEMLVALAHMELCEALDPVLLKNRQLSRSNATMVVADMNLPGESLQYLLDEARLSEIPLVFVAVSQPKMSRLPVSLAGLHLLILNQGELEQRCGRQLSTPEAIANASFELQAQGVRHVIVTLGAQGVLLTDATQQTGWRQMQASATGVTDVTGAGDAFAAGVCWSLHQDNEDLSLACQRGLTLANLTVQTGATVLPTLHPSIFHEE